MYRAAFVRAGRVDAHAGVGAAPKRCQARSVACTCRTISKVGTSQQQAMTTSRMAVPSLLAQDPNTDPQSQWTAASSIDSHTGPGCFPPTMTLTKLAVRLTKIVERPEQRGSDRHAKRAEKCNVKSSTGWPAVGVVLVGVLLVAGGLLMVGV